MVQSKLQNYYFCKTTHGPTDNLRVFVAVAEGGSLAEAARRREISAPAATRTGGAGEAPGRAALVVRTTRSLRLTEVGEQFLAGHPPGAGQPDAAEAAVTDALGHAAKPARGDGPRALRPSATSRRCSLSSLDRHRGQRPRVLQQTAWSHLIDGVLTWRCIATLPTPASPPCPWARMRVVRVASRPPTSPSACEPHPRRPGRHQGVGFAIEGQGPIGRASGTPSGPNKNTRRQQQRHRSPPPWRAWHHPRPRVPGHRRSCDGCLQIVLAPTHEPPRARPPRLPRRATRGGFPRHFVQFAAERLRGFAIAERWGLMARRVAKNYK